MGDITKFPTDTIRCLAQKSELIKDLVYSWGFILSVGLQKICYIGHINLAFNQGTYFYSHCFSG